MWFVYIIKSENGMIYTGMTKNLEKRLLEHNTGMNYYTSQGSNRQLLYSEKFEASNEARKREKYFKNTAGKEWLKRRGII